ncbi:hypothetical protein RUM44_003130 [Polyplax serrata]|uniref:LAGLIDADG homing endonuclease n=1 Tax=Polyplax serrata TaxID=468196 RepID=A0ABR1AXL4_POLSC
MKKKWKTHFILFAFVWLSCACTLVASWSRNFNYSRVGGVRIGGFDRQHKTNFTGRLGAGVQIGGRDTLKTKELSKELSGKSEIGSSERNRSTATEAGTSTGVKVFKLRLLLPYKSFGFREYNKATSSALNSLKRGSAKKLDFFKRYDIETQIETLTMTPSPIIMLTSMKKEEL